MLRSNLNYTKQKSGTSSSVYTGFIVSLNREAALCWIYGQDASGLSVCPASEVIPGS